jgi:hypothetical protein
MKATTRPTKGGAPTGADPQPESWTALVGSMLTNVLSEATSSLKEYADAKITEHGPVYMKKASAKVAKTTDELMAWAKDHPVKTAAAVAALVAAAALLRAAMKPVAAEGVPGGSGGGAAR